MIRTNLAWFRAHHAASTKDWTSRGPRPGMTRGSLRDPHDCGYAGQLLSRASSIAQLDAGKAVMAVHGHQGPSPRRSIEGQPTRVAFRSLRSAVPGKRGRPQTLT